MRNIHYLAATAAGIFATSTAFAAPVLNGTVSAGEYGAPTATVATDPAALTSNFGLPGQLPGNTAIAGYNIYLSDIGDTLYGAIAQTGGVSAGAFTNLYFDIDPTTGGGGSEFGIELTNLRGFVAGTSDYFDLSSAIAFSTGVAGGLTTIEFTINESIFRDFIAGAAALGYFGPGGYTTQDVRLNLSQSLSYSVAGGTSYGEARLGTFSVAPVPEPATWAMMLVGFGAVGGYLRRRRVAPAMQAA